MTGIGVEMGAQAARSRALAVLRVRGRALAVALLPAGAAVILLTGGATGHLTGPGWDTVRWVVCVLAVLVLLAAAGIALVVARARPAVSPTVPVAEESAPDLYRMVRDLADRLDVPAPSAIALTPDCDSWLEDRAHSAHGPPPRPAADEIAGPGHRRAPLAPVLVIGSPFLWWMRVGELRAVLAPVIAGTGPSAHPDIAAARRFVRGLDAAVAVAATPGRCPATRGVCAVLGWVARLLLRGCREHATQMERGVAAAAAERAQAVDYGLRIVAQEQVGLAYAGWDRLLTRVALPAWRMGRWPSRLDAGVVAALTELSRRDRLAEGFASRLGERPACDLLEEPGAIDEATSLLAARLFHGGPAETGPDWAPVEWQAYPEEVVDRTWRADAARLHRVLDSLGVRPSLDPATPDPGGPTLSRVLDHLTEPTPATPLLHPSDTELPTSPDLTTGTAPGSAEPSPVGETAPGGFTGSGVVGESADPVRFSEPGPIAESASGGFAESGRMDESADPGPAAQPGPIAESADPGRFAEPGLIGESAPGRFAESGRMDESADPGPAAQPGPIAESADPGRFAEPGLIGESAPGGFAESGRMREPGAPGLAAEQRSAGVTAPGGFAESGIVGESVAPGPAAESGPMREPAGPGPLAESGTAKETVRTGLSGESAPTEAIEPGAAETSTPAPGAPGPQQPPTEAGAVEEAAAPAGPVVAAQDTLAPAGPVAAAGPGESATPSTETTALHPDDDTDPGTERSAVLAAGLSAQLAREEAAVPRGASAAGRCPESALWDDGGLPLFPLQPPRTGRDLLADHVTAMVCCAAVDTAGAVPALDWLDGPSLLLDGERAADLAPKVRSLIEEGDPGPLRDWLAASGIRPEKPVRLV
ncbi:hypothetical protein AB0N17_19605 [Streptomyces sp. NPDC051133]|uniref:hypothetical protein n=1 Tax=Streptomyces sp. NPDC051133 TaxID=3155521 RepID=UPI0034379014